MNPELYQTIFWVFFGAMALWIAWGFIRMFVLWDRLPRGTRGR